ncbi:hypothetical protein TSUD_68620 [Trifolium subterraneum]|uniref:Single-stranded DNA binding protein Ssb-like OB fold domain-containing protein n=1 Tax=Trifolium subterraneum TaxID=3900 RepID=A0A2Z6MKR3_TRISU|nr:hypothetical protein TSUD_68620 [Trifolium subterraneum]
MNIHLIEVVCTSKDGDRCWCMRECYIQGNAIMCVRIPDEYLVGWEMVTKPKGCGGLGLRRLEHAWITEGLRVVEKVDVIPEDLKGTDRKVQKVEAPPAEVIPVQPTAPLVHTPPVNNERKVKDLLPDMRNFNITVKVLKVTIVYHSPRTVDSLVGDETGTILLRTLGKEQAKRVSVWSTIRLRNARIDLLNNNMRLKVQSATDIEDAPAAEFIVKEENNMSLDRYTLKAQY